MFFNRNYKTHDETMSELKRKYRIAEMKCEERKMRLEIFKLSLPFRIAIKFNKLIVLLSIVAIISYTVAAILLQKYTMAELSPTLTTCFYSFFGVELLSLAGIKIYDTKCDTKYVNQENSTNYSNANSLQIEDEDAVG